ncbi:MAG: phosphotransferase family protein [Chloroflexota bacterium]
MTEETDAERLQIEQFLRYLRARHDAEAHVEQVQELGGEATGAAAIKQFGYGRPLLITYQVAGQRHQEVLHTIRRTAFGREREDDRVAAIWLDYHTFNELPRHVPALDMVGRSTDGALHSLADLDELLLVTRYYPGAPYADDLARIRDEGAAGDADVRRAEALATYIAGVHDETYDDDDHRPALWQRRLRDLIGHGEGIMGLTDSYPPDLPYAPAGELRALEEMANRWRWRLKPLSHRLCQVHGDFHPFNIIFDEEHNFRVLDRSRGAWGEAADDVSCLTINYLFFSLQRQAELLPPFRTLWDRFWRTYLARRPDEELLHVIQPWLAWRALVVASPVWYPTITVETRRTLLTFARRVMESERFDYQNVERYLETG